MYQKNHQFFNSFFIKNETKMDARGDPNGGPGTPDGAPGARLGTTVAPKGTQSGPGETQAASRHQNGGQNGGPREPKWEPRDPRWRLKWRNFVDISPPPPRSSPGKGSGRVLDGFGDDFGRVLEGFGRILEGILIKIGKVFDWIFKVFWLKYVLKNYGCTWTCRDGTENAEKLWWLMDM